MRLSQFHLRTVKETPADAEIVSHKLMLKAGMLRKLAAGLYTWSPLGLRVLRKVEVVVREEMNRAGAIELLMPTIQPKELWEETGRWQKFGGQLLKIKDRKEAEYCYGPTAESDFSSFIVPTSSFLPIVPTSSFLRLTPPVSARPASAPPTPSSRRWCSYRSSR